MTKKLSICMIVKDEEKNLHRCLDSLKPLLEKNYTELIIVDTGSTDKTVEIAKEYTDNIYYHEWNGKFSDMRNISISYATGEWIFIMDADEELETPNELISLLENPKLNHFNSVRIREKNLLSIKSNKYVYHVQERLFRNDGTFHYRGSIHNQPVYKHPVLIADIWLMHYGYINEDKELMEKKFKRTATMLKKELEKDPEHVYYRFQLARSYMMHKDYVPALEEITKAYESMKNQSQELIVHRYYVFGEYARMSLNAKKFKQVIEICEEGLTYNQQYLDLYYYIGHAYLSLEQYEQSIDFLEQYLELYEQYNKNELDLSDFTAIEMYTLDETTFQGTLSRIIATFYKDHSLVRNMDKIKLWLNQLQNNVLKNKLFAQVLIIEKDFNGLVDLYKSIEVEQRYSFTNYVELLKKDLSDKEKRELERLFSILEGDYGLLNRIRTSENQNKLLVEFINQYSIINFVDEVVIEFVTYLIDSNYLNRFFKKLNSLTIKKIVKVLIDKEDKLEYFLESLKKDYKYNDYQNNRVYISVANIILLSSLESQRDSKNLTAELNELFLNYIKKGMDYISNLYNVKQMRIFYNTLENQEEKFLFLMLLAYENSDKGNYTSFARYTKEAAETYPYLSKILPVVFYDVYLKKAKQHEAKGEYLLALETYEDILNLKGLDKSEVIEAINLLELKYRNEIIEQLAHDIENRERKNDFQYENVHLITDSPYSEDFIKFVNENFDGDLHVFLLITDNGATKYVNPVEKNNLYIFTPSDKERIVNILNESEKIYIHYLLDFFCDLIAETTLYGKIHWIVWGGDLYNYIEYELYDPDTLKFLKSNDILLNNPKPNFNINRRKTIRKIDFILTILKNDYDLIVNNYITTAKLKNFQYPLSINNSNKLDKILKQVLKENPKDITFMLGNSGDPTNNHIMILEKLKKFSNERYKVIVPLSYGNPTYIQKLIKIGFEILGDHFVPITEFLSEENYIELLKDVDVAFMNHNRQQGLGNILLLLSLNKKIYLKSNSPIMEYLKEQQYTVFNINDLDSIKFNEIFRYEDSILNNQQILFNKISEKIIKKTITDVFKGD